MRHSLRPAGDPVEQFLREILALVQGMARPVASAAGDVPAIN